MLRGLDGGGGGHPKSRQRRGRAQEPGPSRLGESPRGEEGEGSEAGSISGRGAGRGDVGALGGLKAGF